MKNVLLSLLFALGLAVSLSAQPGGTLTDLKDNRKGISDTIRAAAVPRQEQDPAVDTAARVFVSVSEDTLRWAPALTTNLLYDAGLVPNVGLEFPVGKWSIGATWHYAWWFRDPQHLYWQTYGGTLAVRRYFSLKGGDYLTGHHVGLYGQVLTYDFEFGGRGEQAAKWQYGGGLEYGYAFKIGKNLRLDLHLGLGYMGGRFERYDPEYGYYVWKETVRRRWMGPTMGGVTLVWLLRKK